MSAILQNAVNILSRSEARFYSLLQVWSGARDPLRFIWQLLNTRPATDDRQPSIWLVPSSKEVGRYYQVDIEARLCSCDGFFYRHHCGHLKVADHTAVMKSETAIIAAD